MLIPVCLANGFRSHKCNLPPSDHLGKLPITLFQFEKETITPYIIISVLYFIMGLHKEQAQNLKSQLETQAKPLDYITGNYVSYLLLARKIYKD